MAAMWQCEVPECGAENEPTTTRCVKCGAVRGEAVAPPRPTEPRGGHREVGPSAERKRNMVFFYLAIWIPVTIWIIIVFTAC
jgi:hypothetical protein